MVEVNRYCDLIQKKTVKLLKKMFGYTSIKQGLNERKRVRTLLESKTNKNINDFTESDVKLNGYLYARYRTLDRILELYLESVCLKEFTIKEFENYEC